MSLIFHHKFNHIYNHLCANYLVLLYDYIYITLLTCLWDFPLERVHRIKINNFNIMKIV